MGIPAHYLKDPSGEKFYPYAHADATYDRNGNKVGDRLDILNENVNIASDGLDSHIADTDKHITNEERVNWNNINNKMNKANPEGTGSFSLNRKSGTTVGDKSVAVGENTTASAKDSVAEGISTIASGIAAHAEGESTHAITVGSHAEGKSTQAGNPNNTNGSSYAHAEGVNTHAYGRGSHAEGESTLAQAQYSHAEGGGTQATGVYAHAEGCNNGNTKVTASGKGSHAEGWGTTASGSAAHAEGIYTQALGEGSHAEGYYRRGVYLEIVEGRNGYRMLDQNKTLLPNWLNGYFWDVGEESAIELGSYPLRGLGLYSVDDGTTLKATVEKTYTVFNEGNYDLYAILDTDLSAEITVNPDKGYYMYFGKSAGQGSHSEGGGIALGTNSHAEGSATWAAHQAHAEGFMSAAMNTGSHAEGIKNAAYGKGSHAEGSLSKALGDYSHVEGYKNSTFGNYSHVEGYCNEACDKIFVNIDNIQLNGFDFGNIAPEATNFSYNNIVYPYFITVSKGCSDCLDSLPEKSDTGYYIGNVVGQQDLKLNNALIRLTDTVDDQIYIYCKENPQGYSYITNISITQIEKNIDVASIHIQGKYAIIDKNYAHVVGGGTSDTDRKNIHTLDWDGNAEYAGDVTATKEDGTKVSLIEIENDYLKSEDKEELESAIDEAKNSALSYTDTKIENFHALTDDEIESIWNEIF